MFMGSFSPQLLVVFLLSALPHRACAQTTYNFYVDQAQHPPDQVNTYIKMEFSQYQPTCGWKLFLKSSEALSYIVTGECSTAKQSSYWYNITSMGCTKDLKVVPEYSISLNIYGSFGMNNPSVTVYWGCICDQTTYGQCQPVSQPADQQGQDNSPPPIQYQYGPPTQPPPITPESWPGTAQTPSDSPPTTTASTEPHITGVTTSTASATTAATTAPSINTTTLSSTTATTTITTTTPSTVPTTGSTSVSGNSPQSGWNLLYLEEQPGLCYTGTAFTTVPATRRLVGCGALCLLDETCAGINFRQEAAQCDLVYDGNLIQESVTSAVTDCVLYKVVFPA